MNISRAGRRAPGIALRALALVGVVLAALWLDQGPAAADDPDAFDREIAAEIQAQSPDAASAFRGANEARDRGDLARARELYQEVRRLAPGFYHATRRLCGVQLQLGNRATAISLCREARAVAETTENLGALAVALASPPHDRADVAEAQRLVSLGISRAPDDAHLRETSCQVAIAAEDLADLGACVHKLETIAPRTPSTHVFATIHAASEGRFDDARASLERARALGLAPEQYQHLSTSLDQAIPLTTRAWSAGWRVAVAWIGTFVLLLALGSGLSRMALGAARRVPESADGHPHGAEKTLRRVYRAVLWLCCGFYYLSIPLLLVVVVLAGGGLILGFFMLGTIPVKLVVVIGLVTLTTVWAVIKSLFVRAKQVDPGRAPRFSRSTRGSRPCSPRSPGRLARPR